MSHPWIKDWLEQRGISQRKMAITIGMSTDELNKSINQSRKLEEREILLIAKFFSLPAEQVITGKAPRNGVHLIPIGGDVAAGQWTEVIDSAEVKRLRYCCLVNPDNLIALRVQGDSMNRWASDGQYIIVDKSQRDPNLLNGHPIVALRPGEGTFKIFKRQPDRLEPYSNSPDYHILTIDHEWEIFGKVIDAIRNPQIV